MPALAGATIDQVKAYDRELRFKARPSRVVRLDDEERAMAGLPPRHSLVAAMKEFTAGEIQSMPELCRRWAREDRQGNRCRDWRSSRRDQRPTAAVSQSEIGATTPGKSQRPLCDGDFL